MNFKGKMREKSGITLITLVVAIIILLILAGITIATITSDNGIIKNASDAKEQTEIAEEKEIVDRATIQAMGNNKRGNLVEDELQEQLDKITDSGKTEVSDNGEEFEVIFVDSNRYYTVDKDGNIVEEGKIVIDKSPGDITKDENGNTLKGDESEPYEIWCIEDLVEWSNNYNNYINSKIILCQTLDFNSNLSYSNGMILGCDSIEELKDLLTNKSGQGFTPIDNFSGIFDGQYCEIKNIYVNKDGNSAFFINTNNCTIKNLVLDGNIVGSLSVGGLISHSSGNTTVENCGTNINIKNISSDALARSGGIVGLAEDNTKIINCYNLGIIDGGNYIGGIVGQFYNSFSEIINCYNKGDVKNSSYVQGGITGWWAGNTLKNCYNIGDTNEGNSRFKSAITPYTENSPSISNCYYLQGTGNSQYNIISKSESEMCAIEFVELLGNENWKQDKFNVNDGYPILIWQNEN